MVFDGIDDAVEALFSIPNVALWIAFGLFGWCAWIIVWNARRHYRPFAEALALRLAATEVLATQEDARAAFAADFARIDAALADRAPGGAALRHAWLQYRDTLLDVGETPIRATVRPDGYFLHLGDETRVLAWWANIFVAVGLTFTFLGIVAALLKAVQAMGGGADPANMQVALVALLHITAAKFWTSIGGVMSSIVLRVFDRHWHSRIARGLDRLCARLEAGTVLVTPQRLAAGQERLAAEQVAELRRLGTIGAGGGGAEIAAAAERLSMLLGGVTGQLGEVVGRAAAGLDATARRAAEASGAQAETLTAAGDDVRALLGTLTRVVAEMGTVFGPMRAAADSIERSIAAGADQLDAITRRAAASEAATRATADALDRASRAAEGAFASYADRFEGIDVALASALERVRAASADHAALLTGQVARVDDALAQAVDRLAGALGVMGELVATIDDLRGEMRDAARTRRRGTP